MSIIPLIYIQKTVSAEQKYFQSLPLLFGMKVFYALSFFVPVIRRIHVRFF